MWVSIDVAEESLDLIRELLLPLGLGDVLWFSGGARGERFQRVDLALRPAGVVGQPSDARHVDRLPRGFPWESAQEPVPQ